MNATPAQVAQTVRARQGRDNETVLAAMAHAALLDEVELRELVQGVCQSHPGLVLRGVKRLSRTEHPEVARDA